MALRKRIDGSRLMATRMHHHLEDPKSTISPDIIERFATGSASRRERRIVIRHLLKGCLACGHQLGQMIPLARPQELENIPDEDFDRSLDRAFETLLLRRMVK